MARECNRAPASRLVRVGPAPCLLDVAAPALGVQPALLGRLRGPGALPRATHLERVRKPTGQALQRELAVAQLRARVLRAGGDPRAEPALDARLLRRAQRGA